MAVVTAVRMVEATEAHTVAGIMVPPTGTIPVTVCLRAAATVVSAAGDAARRMLQLPGSA